MSAHCTSCMRLAYLYKNTFSFGDILSFYGKNISRIVRGHIDFCKIKNCRRQINKTSETFNNALSFYCTAAENERYMYTAFVTASLVFGITGLEMTAMVGGVNNKGVIVHSLILEKLYKPSYIFIETAYSGKIVGIFLFVVALKKG